LPHDLESADVILVGISRTSKTPTSMYLANRGIKTANVPLVPDIPPPPDLKLVRRPLVVGLIASPERIIQIRQNRLLSLNASDDTPYVDRQAVSSEVSQSRRMFQQNNWPVIDVTRRSIEETAAAIIDLYKERQNQLMAQ
jgi:regulator of PEP synthase PpsR (kinase-PPPase family)